MCECEASTSNAAAAVRNATDRNLSTSTYNPRIRPRHLYFMVFIWISTTGGRFLAPFLEHEGSLSGTAIGALLAVQQAVGVPAGSSAGAWADRLEQKYPGKGRAMVLASGLVLGTGVFLLHSTFRLLLVHSGESVFTSFTWFLILRVIYAISVSLVFPVMDGMCLEFLDRTSTKDDYGKERLYGAVSWAIANLIMAPLLDKFGFVVLYPMGAVAGALSTLTVYAYSQECIDVRRRKLCKRRSDVVSKDFGADDLPVEEDSGEERLTTFILFRMLIASCYGVAFVFAVFTLASGQAVVESLVFLFFEFLGSSYLIMGLTVLLTVAFEIPIFHIAPTLLERFGAACLLQAAAACYVIRVIGYTLIPEGRIWFVLLFEPLHGVTYACSVTATVDFVSQLMPPGYEASGQGLVYLFRGAGSLLGLLLGGWAEDKFGPRLMYRAAALIVTFGSVIFGVVVLGNQSIQTSATGRHQPIPQNDEVELTARDSTDSFSGPAFDKTNVSTMRV